MDPISDSSGPEPNNPYVTGGYLVVFQDEDTTGPRSLAELGLSVASTADFGDAGYEAPELARYGALYLDRLNAAVVPRAAHDQVQRLAGLGAVVVEPERFVYASDLGTYDFYPTGDAAIFQPTAVDESRATWGLQATKAADTQFSGLDVGVAVLDTGFDLDHPDFVGRQITSKSFIADETVQDFHGHGTHCIGTACGPVAPEVLPRYGVATQASIFAGKVLNREGRGTDGQVLAGMNWAIANGCRVISMSLGTPTRRGEPFSRAFEQVARRALAQGTVMVAAAGNESRRDMNIVNSVAHPANCPSILAVAAVDQAMRVAFFSNQGARSGGGIVDLSAPGVNVYSSYVMPALYRVLSGTSMATPHVAGILALFAESKPEATGEELRTNLLERVLQIPGAAIDVGAGLAQAP